MGLPLVKDREFCGEHATGTTRVLIADDHTLFRHALRSLLESSNAGLTVIGEAQDGLEAVSMTIALRPDILLIDLCMPGQNGTESIALVKRRVPSTRIVAVTGHLTEEHVHVTLEAGADGYVLKDDSRDDLLAALSAVRQGRMYLSAGIAGSVIAGYLDRGGIRLACSGQGAPPADVAPLSAKGTPRVSWHALTTRERQMLKLVAEGRKNREIAAILSLSSKTVEKHRASVMRKMEFSSLSELVAYALERRLV